MAHGDESIAQRAWQREHSAEGIAHGGVGLAHSAPAPAPVPYALCAMRYAPLLRSIQGERGKSHRAVGVGPLAVSDQAALVPVQNAQCRINGG